GPTYLNNGGGLSAPGGGSNNDDFVGLERIAVMSNTAAGGGGGVVLAPGTIRDSWFAGNTSNGSGDGGGLQAAGRRGNPTISGSTISGNTLSGVANGGGGLAALGGVNLVDSTVSGNSSRFYGGGVRSSGATGLTIASSTIVLNKAFYDNVGKTLIGAGVYLGG